MVTKLLTMGMLAFLMAATAIAETRLALVIEQQDYSGALSDVTSAPQEADEIEAALQQTGFTVTRKTNLNRNALDWALSDFRAMLEQAGPDAVGFVYYTGHGAQHPRTGDSYLLGVNARLNSASDFAAYGLDMKSQRDGFAATGAKAVFLVFDACRNIPAVPGYKANTKGLNRVEAKADMLIAYATSLGDVAEEGIYAPILAEELVRAGQAAETAFTAAQRRVAARTGRAQLPWTNNLLYNEVCFNGCTVAAASTVTNNVQPTPAPVRALDYHAGDEFRDTLRNGTKGPEMVVVPAGSFMMGSPTSEEGRDDDEGPQRGVTIGRAFAVGKYEVTVAQFNAFVQDTGYDAGNRCFTYEDGSWDWRDGKTWRSPGFSQMLNEPVVCVDWNAATAYAAWLSQQTGETYRLLTEAEWEYAARAGTTTPFSFGATLSTDQANYNGNYTYGSGKTGVYREKTVAVGSFPANAFGLHDMHGNVWEWVEDCWTDDLSSQSATGNATLTLDCPTRVLRGGSWINFPQSLRSANRNWGTPENRSNNMGFRLARTLSD